MPVPTPPNLKPVLFPQPLARGRRLWLLLVPVVVGVAAAGWWPLPDAGMVAAARPPATPEPRPTVAPESTVTAQPEPLAPERPLERRREAPASVSRSTGSLAVSSMPWGEVTVDGRRVGPSPQTAIALRPGVHEVRIFRPGYKAYSAKVKIEAGRTTRLTRIVLPDSSIP